MKLSYSTWGMQTTPIDVAVRHCARLGFAGLELTVIPGWPTDAAILSPSERRAIRRLYDDHHIELCGMSGNVPLLEADATARADATQRFKTYLDMASEMQLPGERLIVTTTSGGIPADWDHRREELAETLAELADHAEAQGVMVGIEPHVGAALRTPADVRWLVDAVNSNALTIHFDISHFNVQGMEMEAVISELAPLALHTHVKDERGVEPDHQFLIPGEGDMDYVAYLKAMDKAGYTGHIVVEISLMVQARPDYDPLAAATQSYRVLSAAFSEAGIKRV